MKLRTIIASALVLAATSVTALADGTLTVTVTEWDEANGTLTFNDRTIVNDITADLGVPADLKAGDIVVIEYEGGEDGIDRIVSVTRK